MQTVRFITLPRFLLLLAMALGTFVVSAQAQYQNPSQVYGYDPLLYNGKVYSFYPVPGTEGTQYLFDTFDSLGSITVRGVTYSNLTLNYDIYNQLLILKYKNAIGSQSLIEISFAWLEKASLWNCNFEPVTEPNAMKHLYQIIGNGAEKIMYYRYKELSIDTRTASKAHFFSNAIRELYVKTDNRMVKYKNNRTLIAVFDKSRQDAIKKYLHKNKIKAKKASDQVMTELINFCNTLN